MREAGLQTEEVKDKEKPTVLFEQVKVKIFIRHTSGNLWKTVRYTNLFEFHGGHEELNLKYSVYRCSEKSWSWARGLGNVPVEEEEPLEHTDRFVTEI